MGGKINLDWKLISILVIMFIVILIFWNTPFVYPIKILVVLLHEISHGLAAVLTGGRIVKIELSQLEGGACWSAGGIELLVLPAGYLGSMLLGGLILVFASRSKFDKFISGIVGLAVLLITLFFVRNLFGIIWGLLFSAALIATAVFAPGFINDFILKFIGLVSILYAVLDIKSDLIQRTVQGSDAYQMSRIIPLPPIVWGIIWIIIALAAAVYFLIVSSKVEQ